MADKRKFSPDHTYVLDEEDIEELDDLSLTSVMRDASTITEKLEKALEESSSDIDDLDLAALVGESESK